MDVEPDLFLVLFLDLDHSASAVGAAMRADHVRRSGVFALGARDQVGAAQGVVGAAAVTAALRMFSFRMWGHGAESPKNNGATHSVRGA